MVNKIAIDAICGPTEDQKARRSLPRSCRYCSVLERRSNSELQPRTSPPKPWQNFEKNIFAVNTLKKCIFSENNATPVPIIRYAVEVFSWTDPVTHKELWADVVHEGLPDSYNFPWVRMTPDGYAVAKEAGNGC